MTDAGKEAEHGEDHRDAFAVAGCHCSDLVTDDEGAAAESDEDVSHDEVADVVIAGLATEVDRQACAQECERQTEAEALILDVARVAHPQTEYDAPETRSDVVDLQHVACFGDRQTINDLDELVEVLVPAVEAELDGDCDHDGSDDGALPEKLPADKVGASKILLPKCKDREQQQTDDDHGNEGAAAVGDASIGLQAEWQEEEYESSHEEECTNDVEFMEVVGEGLQSGAPTSPGCEHAQLLCFPLIELEEEAERGDDHDLNDSECANGPAPSCKTDERLSCKWPGEGSDDLCRLVNV